MSTGAPWAMAISLVLCSERSGAWWRGVFDLKRRGGQRDPYLRQNMMGDSGSRRHLPLLHAWQR
jgi:hypothetical protein